MRVWRTDAEPGGNSRGNLGGSVRFAVKKAIRPPSGLIAPVCAGASAAAVAAVAAAAAASAAHPIAAAAAKQEDQKDDPQAAAVVAIVPHILVTSLAVFWCILCRQGGEGNRVEKTCTKKTGLMDPERRTPGRRRRERSDTQR